MYMYNTYNCNWTTSKNLKSSFYASVCIANSLKLRKQIWNYEIKLSQQQLVKNMKFLFYIIKCSSFEKGIKKINNP